MRKRLEEAECSVRKYREQLATAEMRIDRLQSKAVAVVQARSSPKEEVTEEDVKLIEDRDPEVLATTPVSISWNTLYLNLFMREPSTLW